MLVVMTVSQKSTGFRTSDAMCKLFVMYFFNEEATNPCDFLDMCAPIQKHELKSANRHTSSVYAPYAAYRSAYPAYRSAYPVYRATYPDKADKHPRHKRGLRLLRHLSSVSLRSGPCHDLIIEDRRW